MSQNTLDGLLNSSLKNLRELIDVNTIIGDPVKVSEETTIIPVSKVSFGFASGGLDIPVQNPKDPFGGGSGGGVTIIPIGFIVVNNGNVSLMQIENFTNSTDRIIEKAPEYIDKIAALFAKKKKDDGGAGGESKD